MNVINGVLLVKLVEIDEISENKYILIGSNVLETLSRLSWTGYDILESIVACTLVNRAWVLIS